MTRLLLSTLTSKKMIRHCEHEARSVKQSADKFTIFMITGNMNMNLCNTRLDVQVCFIVHPNVANKFSPPTIS